MKYTNVIHLQKSAAVVAQASAAFAGLYYLVFIYVNFSRRIYQTLST